MAASCARRATCGLIGLPSLVLLPLLLALRLSLGLLLLALGPSLRVRLRYPRDRCGQRVAPLPNRLRRPERALLHPRVLRPLRRGEKGRQFPLLARRELATPLLDGVEPVQRTLDARLIGGIAAAHLGTHRAPCIALVAQETPALFGVALRGGAKARGLPVGQLQPLLHDFAEALDTGPHLTRVAADRRTLRLHVVRADEQRERRNEPGNADA